MSRFGTGYLLKKGFFYRLVEPVEKPKNAEINYIFIANFIIFTAVFETMTG